MAESADSRDGLICPSARPEMAGAVVFGVVGGTVNDPQVGYLAEPLPVTEELLALAQPVTPTEVFRFAAPCAGCACRHFDGSNCTLVQRTVQLLPAVSQRLPPCRVRAHCRWWWQEGRAACLRCPQVVSENYLPTQEARLAAGTDEGDATPGPL